MSDRIVEDGRESLRIYKATGVFPNTKELCKERNDFAVLRCIFQEELEAWAYIAIEQEKNMVELSLKLNNEVIQTEKAKEALICSSALLAQSCIDHYSEYQLDSGNFKSQITKTKWIAMFKELQPKVIQLWLKAFQDKPMFLEKLKEHMKMFGDNPNVELELK